MRKMIYVAAVVGVVAAVGCTSGGVLQCRGNVEADSIVQGSVCDADSTLGEWVKIGHATPMTDSRAVHYNLTITHRQHSKKDAKASDNQIISLLSEAFS